jgi:hypothetical protein
LKWNLKNREMVPKHQPLIYPCLIMWDGGSSNAILRSTLYLWATWHIGWIYFSGRSVYASCPSILYITSTQHNRDISFLFFFWKKVVASHH